MDYTKCEFTPGDTLPAAILNQMQDCLIKAACDCEDLVGRTATLEENVDQIANQQIPQAYVEAAVDNYVAENESGLATKAELEAVETELKSDLSKTNSMLLIEQEFTYINYDGKYISGNGGIATDSNYCVSDAVKIPNGAKRIYFENIQVTSGIYFVAFYYTNELSVSTVAGTYKHENDAEYYLDIPNGASYMVYSYDKRTTPGTIYFDCTEVEMHENFSNMFILPHHTSFFETSKNLFNKNDEDVLIGKYYNQIGELMTNSAYSQSGFIPVQAGEVYSANDKGFFVLFYDKDKNLISSLGGSAHSTFVKIPNGIYYARFMCYTENLLTFQVEKGEESTDYEPYSCFIPTKYLESENKNTVGKKFTSYGDSITARNGWQPYLTSYYGLEHTNLGIGSTTLAYVESVETSYPSMVNADRIQAVKDSNPDILTILGGANDVVRNVPVGTTAELSKALEEKDKTTFIGALSYLVETMLTWKPTLNIILLTTTYSNVASHNAVYTQYAEAVREVAHYYGLKVADTNRESGITQFNTSTYTSDGIHPNEAGNLRIANIVGSEIEGLYRIN